MLRLLAAAAVIGFLAIVPNASSAIPIAYDSPSGTFAGPSDISLGETRSLELWFDAGEGFYDFSLSFAADSGIELDSFTPDPGIDPDVQFVPGDAGTLVLIETTSSDLRTGRIRIGELIVSGTVPGAELNLVDLPNAIEPSFTDENFEVVVIPVPQMISTVVPEPSSGPLVALGTAALAGYRRWRRSRAY